MDCSKGKALVYDSEGSDEETTYADPEYEAASVLRSLQHAKLDKETAQSLHAFRMKNYHQKCKRIPISEKRKSCKTYAGSSSSSKNPKNTKRPPIVETKLYKSPEDGFSIDGNILPRLPPLKSIQLFLDVESCTKPFEKQLTYSDLSSDQMRFSLKTQFVREECLHRLWDEEKDAIKKEGLSVAIYGPDGIEFPMSFKCWSEKNYVLVTGWMEFSRHYKLKISTDWVTIWMFRHKIMDGVCFATSFTYMPDINEYIKPGKKKKI